MNFYLINPDAEHRGILLIKKGLIDCLTMVAHEGTHIGYYKISKGKITKWENKFLDEGIAMYAMWSFEPNMDERKAIFLRSAKSDLKNGKGYYDLETNRL